MAQRQFRTDDTSLWADRYGDGHDGAFTPTTSTDSTANTTFSGTATNSTGTAGSGTGFAAGNLVLIHQTRNGGSGAGAWELNKISSIGSGTDWTLAYPLINTYATTGQVYLLKQYSSILIDTGVTLSASNWDGTKGGILALLSMGPVTVTGTLSANNSGYIGGPAVNPQAQRGEGTTGAASESTSANGASGGGGFKRAGGGAGGHSSNGTAGNLGNDGGTVGAAGGTSGVAALTTMTFGGAGGGGGTSLSTTNRSGAGGRSGGIVIIIAPTITVTGSVTVAGQNGQNATSSDGSGGGAGAGGSILIKGQNVALGSNIVTALGSTVGGTKDGGGAVGGAPASNGRIHVDYSQTLSGTTTPTIDSSIDVVLNDIPNEQNYTILM